MTHDPLCNLVLHTEYTREEFCNCALIAKAWNAAIDAAREAVEAVDPPSEAYDDWHPKGKRLALSAIDTLREEQK